MYWTECNCSWKVLLKAWFFCLSGFSFDNKQGSREREETIFISLYRFLLLANIFLADNWSIWAVIDYHPSITSKPVNQVCYSSPYPKCDRINILEIVGDTVLCKRLLSMFERLIIFLTLVSTSSRSSWNVNVGINF